MDGINDRKPPQDLPPRDYAVIRSAGTMCKWKGAYWAWHGGDWVYRAEVPDGAPSTEHEFVLDHDTGVSFDYVFDLWRWLCSCGERGNWQSVSDDVAERGWLRHCGVPHDYVGEVRSPSAEGL